MYDIDTPTLKTWLSDARLARLKIASGEKVSLVSYSADGTNQRQYHQANLAELRTVIWEIEAELARRGEVPADRRRRLFHI